MLTIDILTLFPNIFDSYYGASILKRAQSKGVVRIAAHNIRDFTAGPQHMTDDRPYGGGAGMVMLAEPILKAVEAVKKNSKTSAKRRKIIVMSAKGKPFTQKMAYTWAKQYGHLVIISGRYEGIDERVTKILAAEEVSIGPYVLTDGDVAAMTITSAVTRLLPGAIRLESLAEESHWDALVKEESQENGSLEYPHYTRPEILTWKRKKYTVPKVLLSGDHKKIDEWRKSERLEKTT
ncbi:MAG: tRNA (guanosine(37)-N1)-methyltransferase TrmD [Patescibacteria group bacterium]|jgi:tRNA (guanine37-N1)-methyltransferase